ncbi:hypothetical protein [Polyangium sorediatum]|uniref:Uncharacterized protein n=1 Tax=Polyangium sorediatum TaxID=889274 RepID=A0ABT6NMT8_9BACT|nr:hypothetical protein [Polyangium sorediatum]MDI1429619.1 hypothetical protein [Polyangium sorediatum]
MRYEEIKNMPEHERMRVFFELWETYKRAKDFEVTQEAADRLAAMCNVTAPRVKVRDGYGFTPRGGGYEVY